MYGGREGSPAAAWKIRCGNQDAAAAITKPKRQWRCRSGNCKAEAAMEMPQRILKSRCGNSQFFTSLQYNHSVWAYGRFLILIARLVPGYAFRSYAAGFVLFTHVAKNHSPETPRVYCVALIRSKRTNVVCVVKFNINTQGLFDLTRLLSALYLKARISEYNVHTKHNAFSAIALLSSPTENGWRFVKRYGDSLYALLDQFSISDVLLEYFHSGRPYTGKAALCARH